MIVKKYFLKAAPAFLLFFVFAAFAGALSGTFADASDLTSTSFIIKDPVIGTFGGYGTSTSFKLISSGHTSLSGAGSSSSFKTCYGFLCYRDPVAPSITFDIDTYNTSTTSTETATPYSVALGTLTTGSVSGTTEGGASTPNGIWFDLTANGSGGAIVSVTSAKGALKSTSVPADAIPSATAAMAAGTANYGICANRNAATTGTLAKVAPFASTCTTTPGSNSVGALTTSAQTIYNTGGAAIVGGRGEIIVDAAISNTTPAHNDYSDTLTFIATGTF
ncbi:MAG TPA: hypothetical protein VGO63_02255 [Candidatus Paceibacterota bacterium]|jgi:hypothetical protein|nr:hypothetical protein [Candidatus Paceibacterota bacterium]